MVLTLEFLGIWSIRACAGEADSDEGIPVGIVGFFAPLRTSMSGMTVSFCSIARWKQFTAYQNLTLSVKYVASPFVYRGLQDLRRLRITIV